MLSVFRHEDFVNCNPTEVVPSYFFVANFLLNCGLGWFFMAAAVFSLLVCFLHRDLFAKLLVFDLICLATIVSVVGVNTFLGVGLNLKSPYNNAIKYDYQSLPFFSLLAASLAGKCLSLFHSAKTRKKLNKQCLIVASVGLSLLAASIFVNMFFANFISRWDFLLFRVELDMNVGYSLFNPTPIGEYSLLKGIQYLGFAFVLSGLAWASRHKLGGLLKLMHRWIELKIGARAKN